MISRRSLLTGLAAAGAAGLISRPLRAGSGDDRLLVSAARKDDGSFVLVGCTEDGRTPFELPLPDRAHGTTLSPDGKTAVAMARRPGRYMLVADLESGSLKQLTHAPEGRHFYGHATYSRDGSLLFTTENDYDNARGAIGVWSVRDNYRRVGEWDSHGVGPHDLTIMRSAEVMVIANGGIMTHPDSGRAKLNLAEMKPNLTFVDARDGSFIRQVELPAELHQNSIRHVDTAPDGKIFFGMQYEGPKTDTPPLVGLIGTDGSCTLLDPPETQVLSLQGYCADVAVDSSGRFGASTFPRGGRVAIWSLEDGALLALRKVRDGAGIATETRAGAFRFSNGFGRLVTEIASSDHKVVQTTVRRFEGLAFDNHMSLRERSL